MAATAATQDPPTLPLSAGLRDEREQFANILSDASRDSGDRSSMSERVNGAFDRLVVQSGIDATPAAWLSLCVFLGIALAGLAFLSIGSLTAGVCGWCVGVLIPIFIAVRQRNTRIARLADQVPLCIDGLRRLIRTGRNTEECLDIMSADTPAPLGDELLHVVRDVRLGIAPAEAMTAMAGRTGLNSLRLLAAVLRLHVEYPGEIHHTLRTLADYIHPQVPPSGRGLRFFTAVLAGALTAVPPVWLMVAGTEPVVAALASSTSCMLLAAGFVLWSLGVFVLGRMLLVAGLGPPASIVRWNTATEAEETTANSPDAPVLLGGPPAFADLTVSLAGSFPETGDQRLRNAALLRIGGFFSPHRAIVFAGVRFAIIVAAIVTCGVSVLQATPANELLRVTALIAFPFCAWLIPILWLRAVAWRRMQRIDERVPDAMLLTSAGVRKGLFVPDALQRIASDLRHSAPDLTRELDLAAVQSDVDSFPGSLRKLRSTLPSAAIGLLTSPLIQSAEIGAPVCETLEKYAFRLRERSQVLRINGGQVVPLKLIMTTILLALPAAALIIGAVGQ